MASRFWTFHWQNNTWRPDVNTAYELIDHSAGNNFTKRGVSRGDIVYIVTISEGYLYLGGLMRVKSIVNHKTAVKHFHHDNLFEAEEHLIADMEFSTPLHLYRRLAPALTKRLRFVSKSGPQGLKFTSATQLDGQTTRSVRELTLESAGLLDRIISITDRLPRSEEIITVTDKLLVKKENQVVQCPDELLPSESFLEGSVERVSVNRYERDSRARLACIAKYGSVCCICKFDFGEVYGPDAQGFIHVHHLRPISEIGNEYEVDPIEDLRPVCPNCHAVLHLNNRCRTIDEVKQLLKKRKK
jgi:hypothetical protein